LLDKGSFHGDKLLIAIIIRAAKKELKMSSKDLSVVLVHGGFVDGSGWQGVHQRLVKKGYEVIVAAEPDCFARR
jgi:hypothetical protein